MISCSDCRYQLLLSSLLTSSPSWAWSGWAEGWNSQLSRKKASSCVSGGRLPSPCWLLASPSCPVLGSPTSQCHRQSLPWLEDSLPPTPWTLAFSFPLRWIHKNIQSGVTTSFSGLTHHSEGPGYGCGPPDVDGQPNGVPFHCLLSE